MNDTCVSRVGALIPKSGLNFFCFAFGMQYVETLSPCIGKIGEGLVGLNWKKKKKSHEKLTGFKSDTSFCRDLAAKNQIR